MSLGSDFEELVESLPDSWQWARFRVVFERETGTITAEAAERRAGAAASIQRGGGRVTDDGAFIVLARLGTQAAISAVRALEASGLRGNVELVDVTANVAGDLHVVPKAARPPGATITALPSGGFAWRPAVAA